MSHLWSFQSFAQPKLDALVGSGDAEAEKAVIEGVTWDEWGDMVMIEGLARNLVRSGANYEGLTSKESKTLDEIIAMLFSPEGLEERLEVEYESPDGVHPAVIQELLNRSPDPRELRMLPFLESGRRLGESAPSDCEYCIFSPTEVQTLHREVEQIMSLPSAWSEDYMPDLVKEWILDLLAAVRDKKKALAALLG
ncbi:MAG: hypothetical protein K8T91_20140 [Planctomycetes bacterium]|nr:hypothetical protein [Planctomycetota bacterium]